MGYNIHGDIASAPSARGARYETILRGVKDMVDITKRRIADSMRARMAEKPLDRIRVTEICAEADVERATFYYHFRDKYDLAAWVFFHRAFETEELNAQAAARCMKKVRKDESFYKNAFADPNQQLLRRNVLEYYTGLFRKAAEEKLPDEPGKDLDYGIQLYCRGSLDMLQEWLENETAPSAEETARMLIEAMPPRMRELLDEE